MPALRALAGKAHEALVAHERAVGGEGEVVEVARAPMSASRVATCSARASA